MPARISDRQLPIRTLVLLLVTVLIVLGAGVGQLSSLINSPRSTATDGGMAQQGAPTPPLPANNTTVGPTTDGTAGTGSTGNENGAATENGTATAELAPQLSLTASDPSDVKQRRGRVDKLQGRLDGQLTWQSSGTTVSKVAFGLWTWSPADGWKLIRHVVVKTHNETELSIRNVFGSNVVYVAGDRASSFDNPRPGTTVNRIGYAAVTATIFTADERDTRLTQTATYHVNVTNTEHKIDRSVSDSDGVDLQIGSRLNLPMDVTDAMPGQQGQVNVSVRNAGHNDGLVSVSVASIYDAEHGLTEPERAVDDTDDSGELSSWLRLRISLVVDGHRTYLAGSSDSFVPLATVSDDESEHATLTSGDSGTLVIEWCVPGAAGNEIQSDGTTFDLAVGLVSS